MTDKFKKRVREHAEKHGMSYQAARQQLEREGDASFADFFSDFELIAEALADPDNASEILKRASTEQLRKLRDELGGSESEWSRAQKKREREERSRRDHVIRTMRAWVAAGSRATADESVRWLPSTRPPVTQVELVTLVNGFEDGAWPEAIFMPAAPFRDIMMYVTGEHVQWVGRDLFLWGVPVHREPELPSVLVAVAANDCMVAMEVVQNTD